MSDVKEKHPTWFKMKIERRQLVKQLEPKTAVNVLLACWDYLETGEYPTNLSALEQIAFSAFFPDMEEALTTSANTPPPLQPKRQPVPHSKTSTTTTALHRLHLTPNLPPFSKLPRKRPSSAKRLTKSLQTLTLPILHGLRRTAARLMKPT